VRMVFMVLDVVCFEVPALKIPACGAGVRMLGLPWSGS
jgi:hypothetical protein